MAERTCRPRPLDDAERQEQEGKGNGTMRTLNYVVLVLVLVSFGFVLGCESDSPTAPSAPSATMAEAPTSGPSTSVRTMPASFDADGLRPDSRDGFNAYEFSASYDGSMLTLILTEDEMRSMREASRPHRNRKITVGICPVEPHHVLQACGDPIWQGSMRLAGRLELAPIPLASCEGWIVVDAAELSDDRNDGWRNAPCPAADGEPVGSDGMGDAWPNYGEYDPADPRRTTGTTGTTRTFYTDCVRIHWTGQQNVGDRVQYRFELENVCERALRVFYKSNVYENPWETFYAIRSDIIGPGERVRWSTWSPPGTPEVRYCASLNTNPVWNPCTDDTTPRDTDRTKVGRSQPTG